MKIDDHKRAFGNQAENYTKYRKPYTEKLFDLFFKVLPAGSKKIVDVACGTGKSTESLVKEGLEVFGIDHDPLMIEEAKKQAQLKGLNITYSVSAVESMPFEKESFDAVTVGTAFHWFVNKEAINEIKRVLKESGLLFIFWTLTVKDVPDEDQIPRSVFDSYKWERVPSELRDLDHISTFLKDNGFNGVEIVRIPFTHNDTVEEIVGSYTTASSYELLSEENKEKFLNEIRGILTKKLGDRPYFTYEEEIQVCYGFRT